MTGWPIGVLTIVALSVACSVPFVYLVVASSGVRSLAVRNAAGARGQTLLVVSGVIVATAVVTSVGVVGDSLRASLRRSVVTQLGPVDEEVVSTGIASARSVQAALDHAAIGPGAGTLPMLTLSTTVVGQDFVPRLARAQIIEVDFARARQFGGDPAATGISGPTPSGTRAVMSADLADSLLLAPGHRVRVDAYGTSRTFAVDRILPRRGIAGLAPVSQTPGSLSLDLFVPPGTIASLLRDGRDSTRAAQPASVLAVSNGRGGYDRATSEAVSVRLRAATAGLDAQVQPVKQLVLADAEARGSRFRRLYGVIGFFSVLGGVLLLVLTLLALVRDRARSMGILRAYGLRRSRHIASLSLEGWLYAVGGAAVGSAVGVGIAMLVVRLARSVFAGQTAGRVDLVFAARSESIAVGCAIGFLVSLAVVAAAAVVASRRNVVRMIKGRPEPRVELPPERRRLIGAGLIAVGITMFGVGLAAGNGVAVVAGPAIAAAGAVVVAPPRRTRLAVSVAATGVFIWAVVADAIERRAFAGLGGAVVAQGLVMSAAAIALVAVNHSALTHRWTEPRRRRGLAPGLGLAYSRTAPLRTLLIVGMFAVAIFTVTLLVTVGGSYSHSVDSVAGRLGGGAALEVSSDATRPVPARDVAGIPGVTRVVATSAIDGQLLSGRSGAPAPVTIVGFDKAFAGHGAPPVTGSGHGAAFTLAAPTQVIVGADLHSERQTGLPGASVRVGDSVELSDPLTGVVRRLTVSGLVEQGRWAGADHVYVARTVADELNGAAAPRNLLYVETADGTNNDVVASVIDGTHLRNGAYARSFRRLANDSLSAQRQFLDLAAGFAAVGLFAVLLGIGVLMVDRIRERRRQIAVLRALGLRGHALGRAFRVETAVIASEGIAIGVVTGVVVAWMLGASGRLGRHVAFSLPLAALGVIAIIVLIASLLATSVPARRVARLRPAASLGRDE